MARHCTATTRMSSTRSQRIHGSSARVSAWHGAVHEDLGDHSRWPRGLPDDLSPSSLSGLSDRSAASWERGPRHGHATINATPDEQMWFDTFRVGIWPDYFPGVQFSKDPEALNQYFRQMTPNVGPYDPAVNPDAFAALFDKIGPAVFVTHSQGGGLGWVTALKTGNVRESYRTSQAVASCFRREKYRSAAKFRRGARGYRLPMAEFMKLTKIPIIIFYGDNIPEKPSDNPGQDGWRVRLEMARNGAMPSTATVATSPLCTCRKLASREIPTSHSPT